MKIKALLVLAFLLICSYQQSYSINVPINLQDQRISCDNAFTKCTTKRVWMVLNKSTQQFNIVEFNLCNQSQISSDGKVVLCQNSSTFYQVIKNPEISFNYYRTKSYQKGQIILSPNGKWIANICRENCTKPFIIQGYVLIYLVDEMNEYNLTGNIYSELYPKLLFPILLNVAFAPNGEYLLIISKQMYSTLLPILVFINMGGIFVYKLTFNLFTGDIKKPDIMFSQNGSTILLHSSRSYVALLQYSNQTITLISENFLGRNDEVRQISASKDLETLVVLKTRDNSLQFYKKEKGNYVYLYNAPGIPGSYSVYLDYNAKWIIRPINNGATLLFQTLSQMQKCQIRDLNGKCVAQIFAVDIVLLTLVASVIIAMVTFIVWAIKLSKIQVRLRKQYKYKQSSMNKLKPENKNIQSQEEQIREQENKNIQSQKVQIREQNSKVDIVRALEMQINFY